MKVRIAWLGLVCIAFIHGSEAGVTKMEVCEHLSIFTIPKKRQNILLILFKKFTPPYFEANKGKAVTMAQIRHFFHKRTIVSLNTNAPSG